MQTFRGSKILKEINTFIQKRRIKFIKSDSKDFCVTKKYIFQLNAVLLNFLFIEESWKKCITVLSQLFLALIISNVSWAPNQHIRMISEGSCDTEDYSNDAENSALITGINYTFKYFKNRNSYFML